MVVREAVAYGLRLPIGVDAACHQSEFLKIALVELACLALVESGTLLKLQLLRCVTIVVAAQIGKTQLRSYGIANAYGRLAYALALDYDNAVGSILTVKCCSRSVLKNVYALNVVDVHIVESLKTLLHTVNHDKRCVKSHLIACRKRCGATYYEVGHCIRV